VIKDSLYASNTLSILNVIQYLDDSLEEVMIFGHNPEFTYLANYFSNQQVDSIPTCGIFCIDFDVQSWQDVGEGNGIVQFFDYPKKHL